MYKGKRYTFRDLEFWPENGLIYSMDYRDNIIDEDERFTVSTRAEFAARAIALNDQARGEKYADERWELNNLIMDMCKCVKDAKKQGDPFNPADAKEVAYRNRKIIMLNNYNPERRRHIVNPFEAHVDFKSELPPMPQAPPDAAIAGSDSAPEPKG